MDVFSSTPVPGTHRQECENCEAPFWTSEDYYDLCPDCCGPYEEALYEAQQADLKEFGEIRTLRVEFPEES